MSADVLRQAAALMRERAENARPSPWRLGQWLPEDRDYEEQAQVYGGGRDGSEAFVVEGSFIDDAVHIASWHPAVALAVADWLDAEGDRWLKEQDRGWGLWVLRHTTKWDDAEPEWTTSAKNEGQREADRFADDSCARALTVARAYLGESA